MPLPSAEAVTTIGGAAIVVNILFEVIKRALAWNPVTLDRFGPLLAIALGVFVVVVASIAFNLIGDGATLFVACYNGVAAGLIAIGLFKVADNTVFGG
jgi:hypothetical protein